MFSFINKLIGKKPKPTSSAQSISDFAQENGYILIQTLDRLGGTQIGIWEKTKRDPQSPDLFQSLVFVCTLKTTDKITFDKVQKIIEHAEKHSWSDPDPNEASFVYRYKTNEGNLIIKTTEGEDASIEGAKPFISVQTTNIMPLPAKA